MKYLKSYEKLVFPYLANKLNLTMDDYIVLNKNSGRGLVKGKIININRLGVTLLTLDNNEVYAEWDEIKRKMTSKERNNYDVIIAARDFNL